MKAILLLASTVLFAAGSFTAFANVNIFYQATLLDHGRPASGVFDVRFVLYEKPSGGQPLGIAYTNTHVRVTNGLLRAGLLCRNDDIRLKRGWVEAAIRPAGSEGEFTPMRARVKECKTHSPEAAKPCNDDCEFTALRLLTHRLPFSFDPSKPQRGRGFLLLPENHGAKQTSPNNPAR